METDKYHPHLAQLSGLWSISEVGAARLRNAIASVNWNQPTDDELFDQRATVVEGGLAVIPVIGVMTKYAAFYDRFCDCVSAAWVEAEIDKAEANADVKKIVLLIDSPGGMVDGGTQLASRVSRCKKPIEAVVSDGCCSMAYWLAAMTSFITANPTASIGAIGVVVWSVDDSKFWEELGVKFVVKSSGGVKGAGFDHKIDDRVTGEWDRFIADTYEQFVAAVATGRGMTIDEARRLGDGRTYRAAEAMSLKLIDAVKDAAVAIGDIKQEIIVMTKQEFDAAATANPDWLKPHTDAAHAKGKAEATPAPATLKELSDAFPDDAKFAMDCGIKKLSLIEAKAAHAEHLAGQLKTVKAELETVKTKSAENDPGEAGEQKPLATGKERQPDHNPVMSTVTAGGIPAGYRTSV